MSVPPINISRISTNMQSMALLESLRRNTLSMFLEQSRLATGYRFNNPSEDPVGAARAFTLTQALERQDQVLANIRHADSFLAATDSAVTGVSDLLIEARSIASEMVNSSVDQSQRDASAELVLSIIDELVRVGNRTQQGVYLFGGQQVTRPPFERVNGGVIYRGDTHALSTRVDLQQSTAFNLSGAELFGALTGRITGAADLNPALTLDARLADLAGTTGNGVHRGLVQVTLTDPAISFVADITDADTVGDVINAFNSAASDAGLNTTQFLASINPAANGLELTTSAGTVSATEVSGGHTARDLGILGTAGGALTGGDIQPRLTLATPIDALFGGGGAALGSIQIRSGSTLRTVDLSAATTVQDALNTINASGLDVRAEINPAGTGIDIMNLVSGSDLDVGEAGGNTAQVLGIRSFHGQTLLSSLNHGRGVSIREGEADFRIIARSGDAVDVNLDGATTVQDVLNAINAAAATAGVAISAGLASSGNGIQITDATGGGGTLQVERLNLSSAIDDLGLTADGLSGDGNAFIGSDPNSIRTDSVFTVLLDLVEALRSGDVGRITDTGDRLGSYLEHTNRVHGVVGARSRAMTTRLRLTEDAVLATQTMLSELRDLDFTEAITRFQKAQTVLQANLMTGSRILQMSLLDFIR